MDTKEQEPPADGGRKVAEMLQEALKSPYGALVAAGLVAGSIFGTHYATSQELTDMSAKVSADVQSLRKELQPLKDRVTMLEHNMAQVNEDQEKLESALEANQQAWHRIDLRIESIDGALRTSNERLDHLKTLIRLRKDSE